MTLFVRAKVGLLGTKGVDTITNRCLGYQVHYIKTSIIPLIDFDNSLELLHRRTKSNKYLLG